MILYDGIRDNILGERISENMSMDNNGQLICENVVLARTGYYDYREDEIVAGGSSSKVIKVYRSPEEVFDPVSIRSMNFKPLTDDHPSDNVTPDTVGALQKGFMTNVRRGSGEFSECLMADIVVTDPYVIEEIRSGRKRDLSVGYAADIVEENGQYLMKNIRGNHIALVDAGRAGNARIRDSKTVADFEAKGSFNSLAELKQFYPKAAVDENRDKSVLVRLSGGVKLLYSYIPGTSKLFFVRKADPLRDSVEVVGDKHLMKEGQRVEYFGNPCVVSSIQPDTLTGDFVVEFKQDNGTWRASYSEVVNNINQGKVKLLDSVQFDSKAGGFSLVPVADSTEDFSSCFSDKSSSDFVDAKERMGTVKGYTIYRNPDGSYRNREVYITKDNGATKIYFNSWKEAHEAVSSGKVTDVNGGVTDAASAGNYRVGQKLMFTAIDNYGTIEKISPNTITFSIGRNLKTLSTEKFNFGVKNGAIKLLDAQSLKSFAVSVGDRKFVTRAHSAADAAHKVARVVDLSFSDDTNSRINEFVTFVKSKLGSKVVEVRFGRLTQYEDSDVQVVRFKLSESLGRAYYNKLASELTEELRSKYRDFVSTEAHADDDSSIMIKMGVRKR